MGERMKSAREKGTTNWFSPWGMIAQLENIWPLIWMRQFQYCISYIRAPRSHCCSNIWYLAMVSFTLNMHAIFFRFTMCLYVSQCTLNVTIFILNLALFYGFLSLFSSVSLVFSYNDPVDRHPLSSDVCIVCNVCTPTTMTSHTHSHSQCQFARRIQRLLACFTYHWILFIIWK